MTVCLGPSTVTPSAVVVSTPPGPVAVIQPLYWPRAGVVGVTVTGTSTLWPAGTVTDEARSMPVELVEPLEVFFRFSSSARVIGLVPSFVYVMLRSARSCRSSSAAEVGDPVAWTDWVVARTASTRPAPDRRRSRRGRCGRC